MGLRNAFVLAAFSLLTTSLALARPVLTLLVPPPGQYTIEQLWRARITSDSAYRGVWLEGFIVETGRGQVFWAKTNPFDLTPGTRVYRYRDVSVARSQAAQGYEEAALRTGGLPAGDYRFRLVLMPFDISDSGGFVVAPMGPPRLVSPLDGDTVRAPYPRFTWTPPAPPPPGVAYRFALFQILPGQTPQEAAAANPPWYAESGLRAAGLSYPTGARLLPDTGRLAWLVTASAGGAEAQSEVRSFSRGSGRRMLTRPEAIALILRRVVKPDSLTGDLLAFLGQEPLSAGDRVRQAFDSTATEISEPTWFAWLNDDFPAEFGHPVRYVFVNAGTGALIVQRREFWPYVNEVPVFQTREELEGDRSIFFARPERE